MVQELVPWSRDTIIASKMYLNSDMGRTKIIDPSWIWSIFCCSGRVSHFWFGPGFGKFPLKIQKISTFSPADQKNLFRSYQKNIRVKDGSASYLLRVKNMLWVGSGLICSLEDWNQSFCNLVCAPFIRIWSSRWP